MEEWIIKHKISRKQCEILFLTAEAAGLEVYSGSRGFEGFERWPYVAYVTYVGISFHGSPTLGNLYRATYSEVMKDLRKKIKRQVNEDSKRSRCETGDIRY